jgi:signal transduction histidine kinase
VLGDQQQLMIVFGNLIRNARDAMNGGGTLRVTAGCINSQVHVAVADTGVGIKRKDLKKIQEPLYSTKARGMGLGLAISRAILEKHAAELEVTSQPGVGSTFTVRIAAAHTVGTP